MFDLDKYIQKPKSMTVKMFNASLESYKRQFDSKPFRFLKNDYCEVPLDLVAHVYESFKDFGVFPIFPEMSKDDIKAAHRNALLAYLKGKLAESIRAYQWKADQAKREGVTIPMDSRFARVVKWRDELTEKLNSDSPIEEELSFNDNGYEEASLAHASLFSPEAFAQAVVETPEEREASQVRRVGRPRKVSFENIDLGDVS